MLPVNVSYAWMDTAGAWSQPQDVLFYSLVLQEQGLLRHRLLEISDRLYVDLPSAGPHAPRVRDMIRIVHPVGDSGGGIDAYVGFLDESGPRILTATGGAYPAKGQRPELPKRNEYAKRTMICDPDNGAVLRSPYAKQRSLAHCDFALNRGSLTDENQDSLLLGFPEAAGDTLRLQAVRNSAMDVLALSDGAQYMLKRRRRPGSRRFTHGSPLKAPTGSVADAAEMLKRAKWRMVRLDGRKPARLEELFHTKGLGAVLAAAQQAEAEITDHEFGIRHHWLGEVLPSQEDMTMPGSRALADFKGVFGSYYWELHFHLPFLVAHALNARGKCDEATAWFHRIFDPTGASGGATPWQFLPFRTLPLPSLRSILTDGKAIQAYRSDPFNPLPDRRDPAAGVPEVHRAALHRQPDRLRRRALPARHAREDRRGAGILRHGGRPAGRAARGGRGLRGRGGAELRSRFALRHRRRVPGRA